MKLVVPQYCLFKLKTVLIFVKVAVPSDQIILHVVSGHKIVFVLVLSKPIFSFEATSSSAFGSYRMNSLVSVKTPSAWENLATEAALVFLNLSSE